MTSRSKKPKPDELAMRIVLLRQPNISMQVFEESSLLIYILVATVGVTKANKLIEDAEKVLSMVQPVIQPPM